MLLRDPIRFVWRYALGWRQPEEAEEPLTLDGLSFGILVHEILQTAVDALETDGGLGKATPQAVEKAVADAVAVAASRWESEQPVPPPVIWRNALALTREVSSRALGKQEGAEASAVSYRTGSVRSVIGATKSSPSPLRPIERLVAQLVGEVFHFGFGRHFQFRHVVLL